jgi:hypothetical protein
MSDIKAQFAKHTAEFVSISDEKPFVVFLCGPTLDPKKTKPSAQLRERIKDALEKEKFTVVLGEDESIDNPDIRGIGINLQDSELEFVARNCNAIVIVADSVGSFCELGLFSWHFAHEKGMLSALDFILLVDDQHEFPASYLNQGPALAVHGHGRLDFVKFDTFDADRVVSKLRARRGTYTVDRRGRPRGSRA